jgi:hypothetical protein
VFGWCRSPAKATIYNDAFAINRIVRPAQMRGWQPQQIEAYRAARAEKHRRRSRTGVAGMDRSIEDEFSASS